MSMSFMSFFIISYYFFLNLVTHDNCISELSAFALQYFSVALYLLCPTFHSWHENHKLNWELWRENWRERERDLKGSWAVKWRRWWQGEGNLLEDKQKRETQMKMRVERYRKRREDKEKWGLFKEDGWIEATELQSAVKYSAYLLCPVSAAQCEMLSRSCERGTASLAFCLCRFVPLRQLVVVFFVLWYSIDPWRRSTASVWELSAGRRGSAPDQQQLVKDSLTCSRTLRQGEGSL